MDEMSDLEAEIAKTQASIMMLKTKVEYVDKMKKLYKVELFKEIIVDGLLTEEVNKLTSDLAINPHTPDSEELVLIRLRSLKVLRDYLNGKAESGDYLRSELEKDEAYLKELFQEQYDGVEYE